MNNNKVASLTLAKVAKTISVPVTTLQGWRDKYSEFMPSYKAQGKRWAVYDDQAIQVARLIKKMSADDKGVDEIKLALNKQFSPIYEGDDKSNNEQSGKPTKQQQRNNNELMSPSQQRTLQDLAGGAYEAFEFNKSLMIQVRHQRELLKIKDQTTTDLQQRVGELERELLETTKERDNERESHDETREKLERAKKKGILGRFGL